MRDFILLICLLIGIAGMGSAAAAPDPAAGSSVKGNFDITDLRTRLFDPKGERCPYHLAPRRLARRRGELPALD